MEEVFTDVPEDTPEVSEPEPETSAEPVQSEQDSVEHPNDTDSDPSVSSDKDSSEGMETLPDTESTVSPEPQQTLGSDSQDSEPIEPVVSPESVQKDTSANPDKVSSVFSDKNSSDEEELLPDAGSEKSIDYTALLKEQNDYLKSLVSETQQCRQELSNIQNAMPGMMCILGLILGLLLLQILASYLRP